MAYLDRIRACNGWNPDDYIPFVVAGVAFGRVRPEFAGRLANWDEVFLLGGDGLAVHPALDVPAARTEALAGVWRELVEQGLLSYLHGELFPVGPSWDRPELLVDRAVAPWLGTRGYGQHLNGYVRDDGRLWMWVGRRSPNKRNFPGKLDHLAAGGLPHGIGMRENLAKECREEADIPPHLAAAARPVGALTYCRATATGLKSDIVYCYDLELPADFEPRCTDGEVESFRLLPLEEVQALVRDTEAFKLNCSLVIIDFLIRHGYLGPEHPEYLELVRGLHPDLL
jgi:isopentenyldiphosphate isomerase